MAGKCFLEVTFKDTLRKKYPYSVLFWSTFSEYGRFSRGEISCPFLDNAPIYFNALQPFTDSKAVPRRYSVKTVFLKLSQNSQKYTGARISFEIKLQACDLQLYEKIDSGAFSCEFWDIFKNNVLRTTYGGCVCKWESLQKMCL